MVSIDTTETFSPSYGKHWILHFPQCKSTASSSRSVKLQTCYATRVICRHFFRTAALNGAETEGDDEACRPEQREEEEVNRRKDRQRETCQSIGRMLRITISMVIKPFILWVLLPRRAAWRECDREKETETSYSEETLFCRTLLLQSLLSAGLSWVCGGQSPHTKNTHYSVSTQWCIPRELAEVHKSVTEANLSCGQRGKFPVSDAFWFLTEKY